MGGEGVLFISFFGSKFMIQEQIKWGLPRCSHWGCRSLRPVLKRAPLPLAPHRWRPCPKWGVWGRGPRREGEQLSTSPGLLPALSAPATPPDSVSPPSHPTLSVFPLGSPPLSSAPCLSLFLSFSALPSVHLTGSSCAPYAPALGGWGHNREDSSCSWLFVLKPSTQ